MTTTINITRLQPLLFIELLVKEEILWILIYAIITNNYFK